MIGTVLAGRYQLTRVLGTGGMGAVYEAKHATTGKRVAIKLLAPHLSKDLKLVARFRREAMAASRLLHENCVQIDDFGEDGDGTFYIAMELIDGRGLGDELRASGAMPPARVAKIGVQLLKALDAAHVGGVLHRDLKPQNVMLTTKPGRPDMVKVVDFGIAKITSNEPGDQQALTIPGTIFGTPEYMSPEQARGETLDARSDLYSASVVLWHLLLGRSPFRGTSVRETLLKVFSDEAPSPTAERPGLALPAGFEDVLRRGLAKNRDSRWPDAASFAAALAPFVEGGMVDLPPRSRPGLSTDGSPPPPTIDKMPAISMARDTVPMPQAPMAAHLAPTAPSAPRPAPPPSAPQQAAPRPPPPPASPRPPGAAAQPPTLQPETRFGSPPSVPPTSVGVMPPTAALSAMAAPPAASPYVPPPVIPPGAPKAARVVSVESVKQAQSGPAPMVVVEAPRRPRQRISPAALVVIVGGLLLLVGFVVVVTLVLAGELLPQRQAVDAPVAQLSTPTEATAPVPTGDASKLQASLAGSLPLDPLARDAALGRAERAIGEGRRADARVAYEEAVAADPTAPAALIGLGTLAMQQRDWVVARDCFEKLIAIDRTYRKQFGPMYARAKRFADEASTP
jgi:serine/threonine protein kinase